VFQSNEKLGDDFNEKRIWIKLCLLPICAIYSYSISIAAAKKEEIRVYIAENSISGRTLYFGFSFGSFAVQFA
jgi:hypothetical protein